MAKDRSGKVVARPLKSSKLDGVRQRSFLARPLTLDAIGHMEKLPEGLNLTQLINYLLQKYAKEVKGWIPKESEDNE